MSPNTQMSIDYRPDVDGLRAVAVTLVLLFHAGFGPPGGYVGVDVFFVISGFLITGIILQAQKNQTFVLSAFWVRRLRRILPASIVVTAFTLIAGFFIFLPSDYELLAESTIANQLVLSNFYFWRNTGYFTNEANQTPLLHTWSLAVEEQFYLLYPPLLIFLERLTQRKRLVLILTLALMSFALSTWGLNEHPIPTFFLLPTRAWELLVGGLLWFLPPLAMSPRFGPSLLSWAGILLIASAAAFYNSTTRFPGIAALLPCCGTAMVIYGNTCKPTWIRSTLSAKPIVFVGLISYSLYLWHWPVLCIMHYIYCGQEPPSTVRFSAIVISFLLSILSLYFIEKPFREKRLFKSSRDLLIGLSAAMVILVVYSFSIITFRGWPGRFDPRAIAFAEIPKLNFAELNVSTDQVQNANLPAFGFPNATHKCLLWGDSHAMMLLPAIDSACKSRNVQGWLAAHWSTAPIVDFISIQKFGLSEASPVFSRAVVDFAIDREVDVVVMAGMWSNYARNKDFEECLLKTVQELEKAGVRVAILRDVADQKCNVPLKLSMSVHLGSDTSKVGVPVGEYVESNAICNDVFNRIADSCGVTVFDTAPFFVDHNKIWRAEFDGNAMYFDDHHLTLEGALRLEPMFEALFESLLNSDEEPGQVSREGIKGSAS